MITVGGGSWDTEISWSIVEEGDAIIANGTTGSVEICIGDGCYTFEMNDSYGDGWNGAIYTITSTVSGDLIDSGDLDSATSGDGMNFGTNTFCIEGGEPDVPGCTDATACNFNPDATVDNGTCTYGVAAYVDEDGDGYGYGSAMFMTVCTPFPPGISLNNSDCDDTLDTVYPGASGTGEGIDNNCDNVIDGDELVPCPGDINGDGSITVADILIVLSEFGCTIGCSADVDADGSVTVSDVLVVLSLFGNPC